MSPYLASMIALFSAAFAILGAMLIYDRMNDRWLKAWLRNKYLEQGNVAGFEARIIRSWLIRELNKLHPE